MNQIEFLLRLSENATDEGEELAARQNKEREAFIKGLLDLKRMNDLAGQNIDAELGRWGVKPLPQQGQQLPRGQNPEPMSRIAQKGPASS